MTIDPAVRARLKKRLIKELKGPQQRHVVVKTAVKIGKAELSSLQKAVPELKDAQLTNEVDKEIIGGMVIIDGSKIIDVSLKGKLQDLIGNLL